MKYAVVEPVRTTALQSMVKTGEKLGHEKVANDARVVFIEALSENLAKMPYALRKGRLVVVLTIDGCTPDLLQRFMQAGAKLSFEGFHNPRTAFTVWGQVSEYVT